MRFLIVTPNYTLRDSLRMVISGVTDAEIMTARDCAGARTVLVERPVDVLLIDGHLRMDELRELTQEMATLAPGARYAVLLDDRVDARSPELTAAGAEVLSIYTQPASEFFESLARFIDRAAPGSATKG
jgi:DNA-binding NarL/FixJ family response regulator